MHVQALCVQSCASASDCAGAEAYLIGLLFHQIFAVLAISFRCIDAPGAPSKVVQLAVAKQRQHDLQHHHTAQYSLKKGTECLVLQPSHKGSRPDARHSTQCHMERDMRTTL